MRNQIVVHAFAKQFGVDVVLHHAKYRRGFAVGDSIEEFADLGRSFGFLTNGSSVLERIEIKR